MVAALDMLQSEAQVLGLSLNLGKCEAVDCEMFATIELSFRSDLEKAGVRPLAPAIL